MNYMTERMLRINMEINKVMKKRINFIIGMKNMILMEI